MDEAGFLTPDESVAQQHTRARLLARAIVDIGLPERSLSFDEAAAIYRDWIHMVREMSERQKMILEGQDDTDLFGYHQEGSRLALAVFALRGGRVVGRR